MGDSLIRKAKMRTKFDKFEEKCEKEKYEYLQKNEENRANFYNTLPFFRVRIRVRFRIMIRVRFRVRLRIGIRVRD